MSLLAIIVGVLLVLIVVGFIFLGASAMVIPLLVLLGIIVIGFIVLMIVGRKLQKKQDAAQEQMQANAQTTSLFVIKKERIAHVRKT